MAAKGFGRWESDPLFPGAECVQDSADRMESFYRLFLHERKLVQGDMTPRTSVQHERDVVTALGTTKWQLEQFEREVNAAAFTDKTHSRKNAISKFRQFTQAIREQVAHVEESIGNLRTDASRISTVFRSNEQDTDGLASFLSGGGSSKASDVYVPTNQDEIVEVKINGMPQMNGCLTSEDHVTSGSGYVRKAVEAPGILQHSSEENECQEDHNACRMYDSETGGSEGRFNHYTSRIRRQYWRFLRNFRFVNSRRESLTKRRKDGEVSGDLSMGSGINLLPSVNTPSADTGMYFWRGIPRFSWVESLRLKWSRSQVHVQYNDHRVRLVIAILIALAVLSLLAFQAA